MDSNSTSNRSRGAGPRTKLIVGFVGMLAILIAVGAESITLLDELGGSIDVILRENYTSVIACGRMKEALERMDSGALFALAGEEGQGRTLAAEHRPRFEEALKTELGNVTLPGEGERAERLRRLYGTFAPTLERVLAPEVPLAERRALYFQKLYPAFQQIKGTADEILQMNQRNMVEAKDRARETAAGATRRMALLLLLGTAFAGFCVFYLSNAILWPLERVAAGALGVFLLLGATAARAQSPIATDRPGILFSAPTVGRGVFQYEIGLPAVTVTDGRESTSLVGLVRYGVGDRLELRLGAPVYTRTREESGFGDLEVGAKWHLLDNQGARPAFALIPSVILPTGEAGFSAEDPVYQLNTMSEWALTGGWGLSVLAGYLNGPSGGDRYGQETFAALVSRTLPPGRWNVYGEAAYVLTGLDGADDGAFLGAGAKYLVSNDLQIDFSFDRGLTDGAPDWLFGLGLSGRF